MELSQQCINYFNRRSLLKGAAGIAAAAGLGMVGGARTVAADDVKRVAKKGNINHSIVHWCFSEYWNVEETAKIAKAMGCKSIELVAPEDWPTLKKLGLTCAISPSHLFVQGMNNPKYQGACIDMITSPDSGVLAEHLSACRASRAVTMRNCFWKVAR